MPSRSAFSGAADFGTTWITDFLVNREKGEKIVHIAQMFQRSGFTLVTLAGLYSNDPIGIAVAKGDIEFVRWLDMFVSDYIQSGAYSANYKKWWGETANPPTLNPLW